MSNNFIQVFEHQSLKVGEKGTNSKGKSWEFDGPTFKKLVKFRDNKDKFYFYELINNGVKFRQFVGVLQVGNVTIEVLPKIDKETKEAEDKDKVNQGVVDKDKWQKILIGMIKTVNAFDVKHTENANLNIKHNSILELYFELFLIEVERLLHLGLIKKYRKVEGNLGTLKGKLKFNKHISKNVVHKEKFYVEYTTYDVDHILHKIIYKTLLLIRKINNNVRLDSKIGNLFINFPELKDIKVNESTFEKIKFTRKTESYRTAINISKMLLLNYHPDISNGKRDVLALMFDMNVLWEKFVLKTLRGLPDYEFNGNSKGQNQKRFWKYTEGDSRNTFLKPDIVINKQGETKNIIIDTKWKQATTSKSLPSNGDLQQLFAYAMYWNCSKVALLYPGESSKNVDGDYIPDKISLFRENIKCNLLFAGGTKEITIEKMKEDIKEVVQKFCKNNAE